jgi:hypothetical protein
VMVPWPFAVAIIVRNARTNAKLAKLNSAHVPSTAQFVTKISRPHIIDAFKIELFEN